MARPFPQDPAVIRRIMRLAKQGKSCRSIARVVNLSRTTVSNIARKEGHVWGAVNTRKAAEANAAYGAEWRAEFIKRLSADMEHVRGRMRKPYTVTALAGSAGAFVREELEEPDARAVKDLFSAVGLGMKAVLDVARHDSAVGGLTDVQEYLHLQKGERPS